MAWPSEAAELHFSQVTTSAGLTHRHTFPQSGAETDMIIAGAVAEDFDGDSWIDLYVLQGAGGTNLMYMNTGLGTFRDEAEKRGTAWVGECSGAAAADYDNDGDIDLCVTRLHANPLLFINGGGGYFQVDTNMLPSPSGNVMSPSWGDVDNDGLLELVIGQWGFDGQNLVLYRNLGAGVLSPYEFRRQPSFDHFAFSPRFADLNNDRLADLPVAGDFNFSQLFLNRGQGLFERVTDTSGVATDENGMGSAIGDFDADGDLDWFVSSIFDATGDPERNWGVTGNRLYRNQGDGNFTDATDEAGVRDGNWGWGSAFGDLDNDGDLDLFHVNGWPGVPEPTVPLKFNQQPARLFANDGSGHFTEQAMAAGAADRGQGRGAILFDYDNDGDLDIFIANNQELQIDDLSEVRSPAPPVLLRNDMTPGHHWLKVRLQGQPPLHRHGIGSRVYATFGPRTEMRELNASSGFLAHGPDRIAHFGLGTNTMATEVRAEWVSGETVTRAAVAADQDLIISGPSLTSLRRVYVTGESVEISAAPAIPPGGRAVWTVNGQVNDDPWTAIFLEPGLLEASLALYEPDEENWFQKERYRIEVRPFRMGPAALGRNGDTPTIRLAWEAFAGRHYQVQWRDIADGAAWKDLGETLTAPSDGDLETMVDLSSTGGFYRVVLGSAAP